MEVRFVIDIGKRPALEQRLGAKILNPNSEGFDAWLNELKAKDAVLAKDIQDAVKPIGGFDGVAVQQAKAKDNAQSEQVVDQLFNKETESGKVLSKDKVRRWAFGLAGAVAVIALCGFFVTAQKDRGGNLLAARASEAVDANTDTTAGSDQPKSPMASEAAGATDAATAGSSAMPQADGTAVITPANSTATATNSTPSTVNYQVESSPPNAGASSRPGTDYNAGYKAGYNSNSGMGDGYGSSSQAPATPRTSWANTSGSGDGMTAPTARATSRIGVHPVNTKPYAVSQPATNNPASLGAASTLEAGVNGSPILIGDRTASVPAIGSSVQEQTGVGLRTQAGLNGQVKGSNTPSGAFAVRSINVSSSVNSGMGWRNAERPARTVSGLSVKGNVREGQNPAPSGMGVRGNVRDVQNPAPSGLRVGTRASVAAANPGGLAIQSGQSKGSIGNSGASRPGGAGGIGVSARGSNTDAAPQANINLPAQQGFPTGQAPAQAPVLSAGAQAGGQADVVQVVPGTQVVAPLESVLPGLFLGAQIKARLMLAVVAVEQGVAPLVAVTENPPCGKEKCSSVVWIGQAQLGPDRRIWVSIDQASFEGKTYSVRGQAVTISDSRPGLQAAVWDEAPTLVSDLVRGTIGSFSDFLGAKLGSKTTTVIPGGGVTQTGSVPDLANFFDARLAGLFSIPAESKALVRVARVDPNIEFIVLYGIAPVVSGQR